MNIAIIGGGIGGLALANCLKAMNIEFHLFESAPQFTEVGAGIGLSESTLQLLKKVGLYNDIQQHGKFVAHAILAKKDFSTIRTIPTENDGMCIDRTHLISILSKNLTPNIYSLAHILDTFEQDQGKVTLHFSSGKRVTTDLVIACDGINSSIRKKIYPNLEKRYSGQTIWRGISEATLPHKFYDTYFELWGDNLRFGVSPMANQRYYWYAVKTAPANEKENPEESAAILNKLFQHYDPIVSKIIAATPKIVRDDMWDLKPHQQTWHQDGIVFLGDAIHATTPNLAQGGCQAIEDAYTLAQVLQKYGTTTQAYQKYEALRKEKTTYIINKSWQLGKSAHANASFLVNFNIFMLKHIIPDSFFINQYRKLTDLTYLEQV